MPSWPIARFWQVCDLSLSSGVAHCMLALLRAASERAQGTLRKERAQLRRLEALHIRFLRHRALTPAWLAARLFL